MNRQRSGTRLTGYATGEAYIQHWVKNGMTYPTSRYLTFKAEHQSPTARAVANARSRKNGRASNPQPGVMPYQVIMPTSNTKATAKSRIPDSVPARGRTARGKYTLEIRCASDTTLVLERLRAPA